MTAVSPLCEVLTDETLIYPVGAELQLLVLMVEPTGLTGRQRNISVS